MIQESLNKSEIRGSRHTATGWQTIAKLIERQVNNIPLGYLYHQGNANPLLKVLTPGILKIGTFSNRAPHGVFDIPDSPEKILEKTLRKYNLWFKIWNLEYVPLMLERQKWFKEENQLSKNDLVYFKLTDNALAQDWRLGKVEKVIKSRDGKIREAEIAYKCQDFDDNTWRHSTVERPVRSIVKLWNLEDTSILENLKSVQTMANEILNVSDAFSSAHIDVFNSSKGNYDTTNDSNMLSQKECVELLVNFVGHEGADSVFDGKKDSIVSEDQIGQRTVELSSETELKCDSSTKTKLTQQIREERIYLLFVLIYVYLIFEMISIFRSDPFVC